MVPYILNKANELTKPKKTYSTMMRVAANITDPVLDCKKPPMTKRLEVAPL